MAERSADWMRQAESDLRHALHAREAQDYDWSAFAGHQAAEKAIKALFQHLHLDAWGHTLSVLLASLPEGSEADEDLVDRAKDLDKNYIPTRYPNGLVEGTPYQAFTRAQAERALRGAETVVAAVERTLAAP